MFLQSFKICSDRSETDEVVRHYQNTDTQPQVNNKKNSSPSRPPRPAEDAELRSLLSGARKVDGQRLFELDNRVVRVPVDGSDDPRHGGEIPDCDEIVYEGHRIKWVCEFCEDHWIGRTGTI